MKKLLTIFNVLACGLMLIVAAVFITPLLPIEHNIQLRIVESGSMEPSIMTGALVLIRPQSSYAVGDVITFSSNHAKVPTTHRIVESHFENGQEWFVTKGDANEEADSGVTAKKDVLGTVLLAVPYAGYVLDFSRQPLGFFFLIVLPALMIIFGEIEKLWQEFRRPKSSVDDNDKGGSSSGSREASSPLVPVVPPRRMIDIATPVRYYHLWPTLDLRATARERLLATTAALQRPVAPGRPEWKTVSVGVLLALIIVATNFIPSTVSYFNDNEKSEGNIFTAVALDFAVNLLPDYPNFIFSETGDLSGTDDSALVIYVTPQGLSVDMRYDVSVTFKDGMPAFCDAINVVSNDPPFTYSGPLTTLAAEDVSFAAPWSLKVTLPEGEGFLPGDFCQVEMVYQAWYFDESTNQGYTDEERVPLTFSLPVILPLPLFAAPLTTLALIPEEESGPDAGGTADQGEQPASAGEGTEEGGEEPAADSQLDDTVPATGEVVDGDQTKDEGNPASTPDEPDRAQDNPENTGDGSAPADEEKADKPAASDEKEAVTPEPGAGAEEEEPQPKADDPVPTNSDIGSAGENNAEAPAN